MWLQFQILWTNIKLLSFQKVLNNLFYFYDTSYSKYKAYCLFHFIPVPSPTPHRAPLSYFYTRNRAVTIIIDCHCSLNFAFFRISFGITQVPTGGKGGVPPLLLKIKNYYNSHCCELTIRFHAKISFSSEDVNMQSITELKSQFSENVTWAENFRMVDIRINA